MMYYTRFELQPSRNIAFSLYGYKPSKWRVWRSRLRNLWAIIFI